MLIYDLLLFFAFCFVYTQGKCSIIRNRLRIYWSKMYFTILSVIDFCYV